MKPTAKPPPRTGNLSLRLSAEWVAWFRRYARNQNESIVGLVTTAVADQATSRHYPPPPPR